MENNTNPSNQSSQQPVSSPQGGTSLSSPSWLKTVLILLIVILIGTIGTIIYQTYQANQQVEELPIPKAPIKQVSPTTTIDETAGWKTYRNEDYGFELKYPLEINYIENREDNRAEFILTFIYMNSSLSFIINPVGMGLPEPLKVEEKSLDNRKLTEYFYSDTEGNISLEINDKLSMGFSFKLGDDSESNHKTLEIFEKIISTYKSLPLEFKDYKNENINISFKYPSDLVLDQLIESKTPTPILQFSYQSERVAYLSYFDNPNKLSLEELDRNLTNFVRNYQLYSAEYNQVHYQDTRSNAQITVYHQANYFCDPSICDRYIIYIESADKIFQYIVYPETVKKLPKRLQDSIPIQEPIPFLIGFNIQ